MPRRQRLATDSEAMAERAASTATSVLSLAGLDAPPRSREHTLVASLFGAAWAAGPGPRSRHLIQQVQTPPFTKIGVVDLDAFFPAERSIRPRHADQRAAGRPGVCAVDGRRAARPREPALYAEGQAAGRHLLDRAPRRRRADVLRLAAAQPDRRVDARPDRNDEPARGHLHGRDHRVLPAGREPAVEGPADDAPQAGARVRPRGRARHAESGRPRLQGPRQHGDVVPRTAADRAGQGAHARRSRGRRGRIDGSRRDGSPAVGARQARVPAPQRPRQGARRVPDAMDAVVPARPALQRSDPRADAGGDGPACRRSQPGSGRRGKGVSRHWRTADDRRHGTDVGADRAPGHPAVLRSGRRHVQPGSILAGRPWRGAGLVRGHQARHRRGPRRCLRGPVRVWRGGRRLVDGDRGGRDDGRSPRCRAGGRHLRGGAGGRAAGQELHRLEQGLREVARRSPKSSS